MALLLQERPSGWEDGRAKNGGLPQQTPELTSASSRFSGLWRRGLPCSCWLRCLFSFLLRGELLLDLEGEGVGIDPVDLGCGTENLPAIRLRFGC